MSRELRIGFFVHSLRSDWNNGNAHFLRGLIRAMGRGHSVVAFEALESWSIENIYNEGESGQRALAQFAATYPEIQVELYEPEIGDLRGRVKDLDIIIVHEWNPPELIQMILALRDEFGFKALFHDTHHRASSSPEAIRRMEVARFDGVIAFGESLSRIYRRNFNIPNVWTLHEAADTTIFYPREAARTSDIVWIGNWGDEERSAELREFIIGPAARLSKCRTTVFGVRYPGEGLEELTQAGIQFGGYLPNLDAPNVYASSGLTLHVPRQQYNGAMDGIPTIRVFEALASGIPLISAPWQDTEALFRRGDYCRVENGDQMAEAIRYLLDNPEAARHQAESGLATVTSRHTCTHRAAELTQICEEVLAQ